MSSATDVRAPRGARRTVAVDAPLPRLEAPQTRLERLRTPRPTDRLAGWIVTAVLTAAAALTRFWGVGFPREKIFDEAYYPANAAEMLHNGYENNPGHLFVVHPPLGKWFISIGVEIFGNNSTGWRTPTAAAGTITVLVLVRLVRRMTGSTLLGAIAGVLLIADGLSLVMARTSLLDIFLQPLIVGGFFALVIDRDHMRARLREVVTAGPVLASVKMRIPRMGPRPWRLIGGMLLGASCSVKWSGVWFLAGFAILSILWDRNAFASAGVRRPTTGTAVRSLPFAFVTLVLVPIATYLATWTGWFMGENSYDRHWADGLGGRWSWIPAPLRSLWHYHSEALTFHDHLTSQHPYESQPWAWIFDARPVNYYYPTEGIKGCGDAGHCVRQIVALGTPALWWAFVPAVFYSAWLIVSRRDWRAVSVLVAFLAGWASWLINPSRTMFFFYMVPLVPFLIIGVTQILGDVLGSPAAKEPRRAIGLAALAIYLGLVLLDFAYLWPVLTGQSITQTGWSDRMWLNSWI